MPMQVRALAIPDVILIEPRVFGDERGFFLETFNRARFAEATEVDAAFVQDNHSHSAGGVLRGLHYQLPKTQAKLVCVAAGCVFDVAVDLRRGSPTFGRWVGERLSASNHRQMWIPAGFAHGFLVLSDEADFLYKTTEYYAPEHEHVVAWNDPDIGIQWPLEGRAPVVSKRDAQAPRLRDLPADYLFP
jgi:dTDP-4-dehydrorhamnose 3,5-epimerase